MDTADILVAQAAELLRRTVAGGAEAESRDVDGQLLSLVAVGRDVARVIVDADGHRAVILRPLPAGLRPDHRPEPESVRERPLTVVRFDQLEPDTVGLAHPAGGYTVVRRCVDVDRAATLDSWDTIVAGGY